MLTNFEKERHKRMMIEACEHEGIALQAYLNNPTKANFNYLAWKIKEHNLYWYDDFYDILNDVLFEMEAREHSGK